MLVIFCVWGSESVGDMGLQAELIRRDGQLLKDGPTVTFQGPSGELARPQYSFRPRGETGKMVPI